MEEAWEFAVVSKRMRISLGGQEVEYETDQAVMKAVGKVLNDIISPFSEGFGALGDKVRVYRARSLAETLSEAESVAKEKNVKLENVSPKFMTQWIEGASAEDTDDDESLKSLWANLLVNVAGNVGIPGTGFVPIIRQLEPRHARLLNSWVGRAEKIKNFEGFMYGQIPQLQDYSVTVTAENVAKYLDETGGELTRGYFTNGDRLKNFEKPYKNFRNVPDRVGVELFSLSVEDVFIPVSFNDPEKPDDPGVPNYTFVDRDFLARLGLLNSRTLQGQTSKGYNFLAHFYGINSLAIKFVEAVSLPSNNE